MTQEEEEEEEEAMQGNRKARCSLGCSGNASDIMSPEASSLGRGPTP